MNLIKVMVLSGLAVVMMATTQIVLAEEASVTPEKSTEITSNQQADSSKENEMQWAWGEVMNLDNQARSITLRYLDYETDQEKDLVLVVDDKTTFENIKDFSELKLKDTLSIDYVTGADNKNIAKNISFEKPDAMPSPAPATIQPPALPPSGEPVAGAAQAVSPDLVQPSAPSAPESAPAVQGQTQ